MLDCLAAPELPFPRTDLLALGTWHGSSQDLRLGLFTQELTETVEELFVGLDAPAGPAHWPAGPAYCGA